MKKKMQNQISLKETKEIKNGIYREKKQKEKE